MPFWVVGALTEHWGALWAKLLPINLPLSALMFVCPITAALMLVRQENKPAGVQAFLKRAFDYKRIQHKIWYAPIFLLMPAVMIVSYGIMRLFGLPLPAFQMPLGALPIFFLIFLIGGIGEEIGWSGYAIDPLQARWGALNASIMLGAVWASWHIVPFFQAHHTAQWVVWQCAGMLPMRVVIVWLYNNTGKSGLAAILFHAMINVSTFLYPNYGSSYDPFIAFIILAAVAATVTFLWGPATLARYRVAPLRGSAVRR